MAFADRNCNHCFERRHQACKSRLHQMPTQQLDTAPGTSLKFITQYQRWIRLSMRAPLQQSEHSTEKNKIKMQEHPAPRIDLDCDLESKQRHVQRVCAWTRKVRSPHGKAWKKKTKEKRRNFNLAQRLFKALWGWQYPTVCLSKAGSETWKWQNTFGKRALATVMLSSAHNWHRHTAACPKYIKLERRADCQTEIWYCLWSPPDGAIL